MGSKDSLIPAEEAAKILRIDLEELYDICEAFDARSDDEWELSQGEHFEWLSKNKRTRLFYEEGVMAIAKYQQETAQSKPIGRIIEWVTEGLTNRRKHTRQMLVRRRVISEVQDFDGVVLQGNLVFLDRQKVIRILDTNGKGLNSAAKREQANCSLKGREPMEIGVHFDTIDDVQFWSQRGMVRIAQNMSENLTQKSRKAWTEAVFEVYETVIEEQRKHLESFDSKIQKAMNAVKESAKKTCQVSLQKQKPSNPFDLHIHHLFDKTTRPDLAALPENLLAMHKDIHEGFHSCYGRVGCEPKQFIEYLTTVKSELFKDDKMTSHLHDLINRLEKVQNLYQRK
jgi:hypothetical protein